MESVTHDLSFVFIELGVAIIGLAVLARVASRWGFSAIPLYLLAGLAFGNGGLAPLNFSEGFIHVGAQIGVLLLLFMLGLEYTGEELKENLRLGLPAGAVDLALNFPPGFIAGLILGWQPLAAVLLGGVTYISSSGVIAKLLAELRRLHCPETPAILSVLVLEDLAMAVYLPLVVDPASLPPALMTAVALGVVTTITKVLTGYWAARRSGVDARGRLRAGMALVARGEFSIVIAGLGTALQPQIGPLSAAYVLFLAILGPILARAAK
jgi:CPA2 family monovalent cation:H+ antiporter-2